uniref:CSON007734 protein n=1 Tax=Culicoides sonorensis TaxID=179676 RepID=A0A336LDM2_CULSO
MFKLICFALLISFVLSVPIDGDETPKETKIDDFDDDDDWGLEDAKSDSKESGSNVEETGATSVTDAAKGPISYIQKIPRRGEKVSTELPPVEISIQKKENDDEEETSAKRERRDTLTREQRKEQKRLAKKNKNKENAQLQGAEQTQIDGNPSSSTKRPRKQKQQKKQQKPSLNTEDELTPNNGNKKQRQGGKKNKEGKQNKNREGQRPAGSSRQHQQGQGKNNGQRNQRKQKQTKHHPTEGTLQ